jgi:hypothetical protein
MCRRTTALQVVVNLARTSPGSSEAARALPSVTTWHVAQAQTARSPRRASKVSEMIGGCLTDTSSAGERAGTRHLVDLPRAITLAARGAPWGGTPSRRR